MSGKLWNTREIGFTSLEKLKNRVRLQPLRA